MAELTGARIAFAGTPEFAVPCLRMLLDAGASVPLVLTQPDRRAGRGRKLRPPPVAAFATERGLPLVQPARLDDPALLERAGPAPDAMLVVAYGLLLPEWSLAWPRFGCVNVHASLLPRWRGAAPIQRALLAGDEETGISIMQMTRGLDTGPVFAAASTPITVADTAADLGDRLSALGADLARESLPGILAGTLPGMPQNDNAATYAAKIAKREARLDWYAPAVDLARQVRAFNPWPVAEAMLSDERRLRVWEAVAVDGTATPGTILNAGSKGIDVAAGTGALRLTVVQAAGGRAMPAGAWLASHSLSGLSFVAD